MEIRRKEEIPGQLFDTCHDGEGTLECFSLLDGFDSKFFWYMHSDNMPAGVSIGEHLHTYFEEIYYLVSGTGVLTYDGVEQPMSAGDVSLCTIGHSHGFKATTDSVLIVVAPLVE